MQTDGRHVNNDVDERRVSTSYLLWEFGVIGQRLEQQDQVIVDFAMTLPIHASL